MSIEYQARIYGETLTYTLEGAHLSVASDISQHMHIQIDLDAPSVTMRRKRKAHRLFWPGSILAMGAVWTEGVIALKEGISAWYDLWGIFWLVAFCAGVTMTIRFAGGFTGFFLSPDGKTGIFLIRDKSKSAEFDGFIQGIKNCLEEAQSEATFLH